MYKRNLLTIFFTLSFFLIQSQEIEGLWMKVRNPDVLPIGSPLVQIVQFSKDSMLIYDFDKLVEKYPISRKNGKLQVNDTLSAEYSISNNELILKMDDNPKARAKLVKLEPTKDTLNLCDSIESFEYEVQLNGYKNKLIFGRDLQHQEVIYIEKNMVIANRLAINKWKAIYFLSFYLNEHRVYAFPIKEINPDSFLLYGIPGEEYEVIVKRI